MYHRSPSSRRSGARNRTWATGAISTPPIRASRCASTGPGTDSGTFDFFTAQINGEEDVSRSDYSASEDDNVTVQGVSGDRGALGYFGLSYAEENASRLKLLAVDGGDGCVKPSTKTVQDGTYAPLSRPLFVYVKHSSAERPEVRAFLDYLVTHAGEIATAARFVPLTLRQRAKALNALAAAVGE